MEAIIIIFLKSTFSRLISPSSLLSSSPFFSSSLFFFFFPSIHPLKNSINDLAQVRQQRIDDEQQQCAPKHDPDHEHSVAQRLLQRRPLDELGLGQDVAEEARSDPCAGGRRRRRGSSFLVRCSRGPDPGEVGGGEAAAGRVRAGRGCACGGLERGGFWSFWFLEEVGVERGKKSRRPGRRAVDSPHNFPLFSARSPPYAKCRSLFPTCCSRAAAAATAESSLSLPLAASDEDDGDSSTFFAGASTEDSAAACRASASEPSSPGPRLRPG